MAIRSHARAEAALPTVTARLTAHLSTLRNRGMAALLGA